MTISMKRVYEPALKTDGTRVLVDRLWPRGITKQKAAVDLWPKDLAPSTGLRKWFHADPERRFKEFSAKYRKELAGKKPLARALLKKGKKLTIVTSVQDPAHSHVPVLLAFLKRLG